ncbi:MAG: UDP-N-acetylmuramate dehydrogenase [Anaerovoracaceae bacterium]
MTETVNELINSINIDEDRVIVNANMAEHTSFKAGGNADLLVIPKDVEELKAILVWLDKKNIKHLIMGNGSNILFKDGGYRGVVIKISDKFGEIEVEGNKIVAGSGALLSTVSRVALNNKLTGLEFASGIPGSLGGAVFMNAGAYGGEMKDVVKQVRVISLDGKDDMIFDGKDMDFAYRHSKLVESKGIVVSVTMELKEGDFDEISATMKELNKKRNEKQPVNFPSAGSFFKRPTGHFAGKLVEDAKLKGLTVGGAQVSELHSGFVINIGDATATDIITLMHLVQAKVMKDFGVMLEPEVRIVGEE